MWAGVTEEAAGGFATADVGLAFVSPARLCVGSLLVAIDRERDTELYKRRGVGPYTRRDVRGEEARGRGAARNGSSTSDRGTPEVNTI